MKKYSKGELAKILLLIFIASGAIITVIALPGIAPVLNLLKPKNASERQRIKRATYRMEEQGLIKIYNKKSQASITVTPKGRKQIYKYKLEKLTIRKPKKWDGLWRLILFDIPEHKRKARNALSRKLKILGLYRLQKSVFIFPYECKQEIDFITDYFGIKKHVYYLVVQNIDQEKKCKTFYKLC